VFPYSVWSREVSTDKGGIFMREDKMEIDSATGLMDFCKSVNSPVKMNKRCAEIILANCKSRDIMLYTDQKGHISQESPEGQEIFTTLDDVIDEVCEWNYEDIEAAQQTLKRADDYISKCKLNSQIEKLKREERSLNFIFYQTKYGRNVEKIADRIAKDVMEQLNLVPIYDVPFYDDKTVSEPEEKIIQQVSEEVSISEEKVTETQIVSSDSVVVREEEPEEEIKETKGAR
jgi:hypothetical protein